MNHDKIKEVALALEGLSFKEVQLMQEQSKFLQQDLVLSMFLPCDSNGIVCPKPDLANYHIDEEGSYLFNVALTKWKQGCQKVLFEPVSFDVVKGQDGVKFYKVGNTQVFNLSDDGTHLYWHHYTIESLLSEFDETINFVGVVLE